MRLPFFNPRKDEVAAIATDLITRFGLRAHEEAAHLAELSLRMGSRRKGALYELVAREIEASFQEARRQRGLRQIASDGAHLADLFPRETMAVLNTLATAWNLLGLHRISARTP